MPRIVFASMIVLGLAGSASAQTGPPISLIVPLAHGQKVGCGFRDIPPGQFVFQVTLQTNGSELASSAVYASNGSVSWIPQDQLPAVNWATSAPVSENQIGTVSGGVLYMSDTQSHTPPSSFYTTNVVWVDVYDDPAIDDPEMLLPSTDVAPLPPSYPAGDDGIALPAFSLQGTGSGMLSFTGTGSSVAIYRFDSASNTWLICDQPFPVTLPYTNVPFSLRATTAFRLGSSAHITVQYTSNDSVNGGAADTIDVMDVYGDDPANL